MVYRTQKIILSPHSPPNNSPLNSKSSSNSDLIALPPANQAHFFPSAFVPNCSFTFNTILRQLNDLFSFLGLCLNVSWLLKIVPDYFLQNSNPHRSLTGFVVCFLFCCISGIAYLHCVLYIIYLHYIVYLLLHWLFYHWTLTMVRQGLCYP